MPLLPRGARAQGAEESPHPHVCPQSAEAHAGSRWPLSTQVELLVMKALSAGLVKGSIDEVDKRVLMTWVQPRVLDLQQVT